MRNKEFFETTAAHERHSKAIAAPGTTARKTSVFVLVIWNSLMVICLSATNAIGVAKMIAASSSDVTALES